MISWARYRRKISASGDRPWLTVYIGDRRSGKTNNALVDAEKLLELTDAERIFFVIPATVDGTDLGPDLTVTGLREQKEFRKRLAGLRNAIVIIDEGLIAVSNRDRQRGIGTAIAKLSAVAAHRTVFTMLTTQAHRVDVQLREIADAVVVKRTKLSKLVLLDRSPRRITKIDTGLRKRHAVTGLGKPSIERLEKTEAVYIGPITDYVYDVPKSKYIDKLSKRASDVELRLRNS